MIDIFSNIVQVIMLATSTDTLLGIHSTSELRQVTGRINDSLEDGFELNTFYIQKPPNCNKNLVHSSVSEEQSRIIVRDRRRRVDVDVVFLVFEEIDKRRTDFVSS